jgi:hypothetical protein
MDPITPLLQPSRKKLLEDHRYSDAAALSRNRRFLQNTVPFVQLDPKKFPFDVST